MEVTGEAGGFVRFRPDSDTILAARKYASIVPKTISRIALGSTAAIPNGFCGSCARPSASSLPTPYPTRLTHLDSPTQQRLPRPTHPNLEPGTQYHLWTTCPWFGNQMPSTTIPAATARMYPISIPMKNGLDFR